MTPEERIQEQERLAYEAELAKKQRGEDPDLKLEDDEVEVFDKKQAELELKRASLSAATCPEVVGGKHPKGTVEVSIKFGRDGLARDATLSAPFAESEIAECLLTAYKAVIVPPFREQEYTMSWTLDLTGKKKKKSKKK